MTYQNMGSTFDHARAEYGGDIEFLLDPIPVSSVQPSPVPMTDAPWLADARNDIGRYHDGPDVPMLAQQVAAVFPDQADYAHKAGPDTSWCGIFIAAKLAKYGIRPPYTPPGDNVGSWMYVDSYADTGWGTSIPIGQEQPGDIAVWRVPHHVNMVSGTGKYIGGNQSDGVTETTFNKSGLRAIIRPPAPGVVAQPNPRPTLPPPAPAPINPALSNFKKCLPLLLVHEGGNDDDPRDPGGRTSRGILQREWDVWRQSHPGLPADVFQAPQDQVEAIYKLKYWDAMHCDALPAGVDYAVFDYGVNSGISRLAKVLQRLVGTGVDGEIGPLTIAATSKADPATLIKQICDERMAFLQGLGTWSTFGRGWTSRVNDVRSSALAMVGARPIIPQVDPGNPPAEPSPSPIEIFPPIKPTDSPIAPNLLLIGGIALLFRLMEKSQMTTTPGQGDLVNKLLTDLPRFLAVFQNPILQKWMSGGAITFQEFLTLPRELLALFSGHTQPALPAPDKPPVDPAPGAPAVVTPSSAVTPVIQKPSVQLSAAGLGASLLAMATGFLGTPFGVGATPTPNGTLATVIPIVTGLVGMTGGWGALANVAAKIIGGIIGALPKQQPPAK